MVNQRRKKDEGAWLIILIILLAILIFTFSPGMMVMSIIQYELDLALDVGQMWTFSIILCAGFFTLSYLRTQSLEKASALYFSICGIIVAICSISLFGFKAKFPTLFIGYFFEK